MTARALLLSTRPAAAPSGPTIAFRSLTSISYGSRSNTTLSPPAGIVDGDILIAVIVTALAGGPPATTPPPGFTVFGTETSVTDSSTFNGRMNIYWKRAASEAGSYAFAHASCSTQCLIKAYSGGKASGTPLGATSNNNGGAEFSVGTGITTTAANSFLLFEAHDWNGAGALAAPAGMTERFDNLLYSADELIASAGATGNRNQTNGNPAGVGNNKWAVRMVELLAA